MQNSLYKLFEHTTRIPEILGRILNLNEMKTKLI